MSAMVTPSTPVAPARDGEHALPPREAMSEARKENARCVAAGSLGPKPPIAVTGVLLRE